MPSSLENDRHSREESRPSSDVIIPVGYDRHDGLCAHDRSGLIIFNLISAMVMVLSIVKTTCKRHAIHGHDARVTMSNIDFVNLYSIIIRPSLDGIIRG